MINYHLSPRLATILSEHSSPLASALPSIRAAVETALGCSGPESSPLPVGGALRKAGAFVGFFPNNTKRFYEVRFTSATDYQVWYKEEGAASFTMDPHAGIIGADEVFKDAKAFILKHWWWGTGAPGDTFTFDANPNAKTIEMPVLFQDPGTHEAMEYTTDHVNSLVDGDAVFTGKSYGPKVIYDASGIEKDILEDYVRAMFVRAGYAVGNIKMSNGTTYHNAGGSIHCGTNAQRKMPSYKWWEH